MRLYLLAYGLLLSFFGISQETLAVKPRCIDQDFHKKVDKMLDYSVEVIDVTTLKENYSNFLILDTREMEEYLVSHLPDAVHFGYDDVLWEKLDTFSKDQPLVVYCSIGYRSEKIGKKLKKKGFTNVQNLYGSIFEWANQGYKVEDPRGRPTKEVHTYNKRWSKWMNNPDYKKVY